MKIWKKIWKRQPPVPEPITIIVKNLSSYGDLVILGRQTKKVDGILTIEIFVGHPGQNLRVVRDGEIIEDSGETIRPSA